MKPSVESIKRWNEFLAEVEGARKDLKCDDRSTSEAWFRGHTQSDHLLLPSLFRYFKNPNSEKTWQKVWNAEKDLFWEFSARARELHGQIEEDWDILFTMQHYQTPTRLLDWTEVLGVAVYFATLGVDPRKRRDAKGKRIPPPCVWVLNPYRLNEITWQSDDLVYPPILGWAEKEKCYYSYGELLMETEGIDWDWPVAIYPRQRNQRVHAQQAWFTIHGDKFIPLEDMDECENFARKVELPWDAIPAARVFLEQAGINHFTLFGDLSSLSRHLIEKNRLLISPRKK